MIMPGPSGLASGSQQRDFSRGVPSGAVGGRRLRVERFYNIR